MTQVHTRDGIFGPGGYGGGLFDGAQMGFGAVGMGAFPSPSKFPNGFPGATYTAKAGETGSSIARDITGNANRWGELVAANPETKDATYGMKFNPGKQLKLPVSWQGSAAGASLETVSSPVLSSGSPAASDPFADDEAGMSTPLMVAGALGVLGVIGVLYMKAKK